MCQQQFDIAPLFFGCPACAAGGRKAALVVRYEKAHTIHELQPATGGISLGEGRTPLVPVRCWTGAARLLVKNESCNPTWSYKDRAAAVSATMARLFRRRETVAVSTGNLGNSVAAYSSAASLPCTVFCNSASPPLQLALMRHFGARVFRGGNQPELMRRIVLERDAYPATIVCPLDGAANPFGIEGFKQIAFEIFEDLKGVPDRVFVPAGSGDGLFGIAKGFEELKAFGFCAKTPRMIACQSTGADCYAAAMRAGSPAPVPVANPKTLALSIAEHAGGRPALDAIRRSGGDARAVSDTAILAAMTELAREGMALEPASSAAFAVAKTMQDEGRDETWVVIGTGASVKWPALLTNGFVMPEELPANLSDPERLA